jgi:chaperonin GroEL (HSP60 family)
VDDGTTTSTLLAHAMFAEGLRNVIVGVSAIGITRGMDRGCEVAVRALQPISRSVKDKSDTAHIATVSAHNKMPRLVHSSPTQSNRSGLPASAINAGQHSMTSPS